VQALRHRDRDEPRAYITGLCLPGERNSIDPWSRGSIHGTCGRGTSRSITWLPMPRGRTR
jgi:hypothetical protein